MPAIKLQSFKSICFFNCTLEYLLRCVCCVLYRRTFRISHSHITSSWNKKNKFWIRLNLVHFTQFIWSRLWYVSVCFVVCIFQIELSIKRHAIHIDLWWILIWIINQLLQLLADICFSYSKYSNLTTNKQRYKAICLLNLIFSLFFSFLLFRWVWHKCRWIMFGGWYWM